MKDAVMSLPADPLAGAQLVDVLFESGAERVELITPDGRLARISERGLAALELSDPAAVLGRDWTDLWPTAYRDEVRAALRCARAGETARFHAYCPTAGGKLKWWEVCITPAPGPDGEVAALLAVGRLSTDARHARQALVTFSDEGIITGWSDEAQVMFGWSAEEALGRPSNLLAPACKREQIRAWFAAAISTGKADELGRPLRTTALGRTGEEWQVECVLSILPGPDGPTVLCSVREIAQEHAHTDLFETAFQAAPFGQALVSIDGRFLKANRVFCELLGYDEATLLTKDSRALSHPDDYAAHLDRGFQLLAGAVPFYQMEKRYIRADGREVWTHVTVTLVRFADGRPKFVMVQAQDLTARREAEARYRLLAENVGEVVGLHDEKGHWVYMSPSVERVMGYSPEELLGRPPLDFARDVVSAEVHAKLRALHEDFQQADGQRSFTLLTPFRRKDGRSIWLEIVARRIVDEQGRPLTLSVSRDVTERYETERLFRVLAENSTDMLVLGGLDGRPQFVSGAGERITGRPTDEILAATGRHMIHPEDSARVAQVFRQVARGETGLCVRYRLKCKDGSWKWVESSPSLLVQADGSRCFVDAMRDASQQVAQEAALAEATRAAEAAAAAKAQFLANMSHEIRTPLTAVIGFSELLSMRTDLPPEALRHADRIGAASRALLTIVNDVLDFSKIEAGRLEIRPAPTAPLEVLDEALAMFGSAAEAKGVDLRLEADLPAGLHVQIDAARVRQVLLNLVGNAMKFTEQGEVVVRCAWAADRLKVAVRDTGPGIDQESQRKLFQRFSQVDDSMTRRHGGTGLGLAICRGLVEAMGGAITICSEPGCGSTFAFEIDAPSAATTSAAPAARTPGAALPVRVLVADDNAANRELVRAILEAFGAQVSDAADGRAAVEMAAASAYDVILMDLRMPGLDGHGALAEIRRRPGPNQQAPVLAFTADVLDTELEGFDGAVAKPIAPARLAEAIAGCVDRRPGAQPSPRRRPRPAAGG